MGKFIYVAGLFICFVVSGGMIMTHSLAQIVQKEHQEYQEVTETKTTEQWMPRQSKTEKEATEQKTTEQWKMQSEDEMTAQVQPQQETTENTIREKNVFCRVDKDYLTDALFIGDSRTEGLMEYGGVSGATFFATAGMSVFKLDKQKLSIMGVGNVTLSELLQKKHFEKIYLMLGINEAGYPWDSIIEQYTNVVEEIEQAQPDATIFLCANLHVTKKKSEEEKYINNTTINRINEMIADVAREKNMYYIDVNECFDDAEGNLEQDLSSDNVHIYGKYYKKWIDWICTKGVT